MDRLSGERSPDNNRLVVGWPAGFEVFQHLLSWHTIGQADGFATQRPIALETPAPLSATAGNHFPMGLTVDTLQGVPLHNVSAANQDAFGMAGGFRRRVLGDREHYSNHMRVALIFGVAEWATLRKKSPLLALAVLMSSEPGAATQRKVAR